LMEDRKLVDLDENEVLTYPINLSSNVKWFF
jgi:hypothetical protein